MSGRATGQHGILLIHLFSRMSSGGNRRHWNWMELGPNTTQKGPNAFKHKSFQASGLPSPNPQTISAGREPGNGSAAVRRSVGSKTRWASQIHLRHPWRLSTPLLEGRNLRGRKTWGNEMLKRICFMCGTAQQCFPAELKVN